MKYVLTIILLLGNFMISNSSVTYKTLTPIYVAESHEITITAKRIKYSDVELLARLIQCEAGNQSLEGMIAVGKTVLNRSRIQSKPIKKIIFQRDKKGNPQFDGIDTKYFYKKPSVSCFKAAREAFNDTTIPNTIYYFFNPETSTDTKWIKYIKQYKWEQIGDHLFCHYNK